MAEIIADLPTRRGRPSKYPWDEWVDGKARVAQRGVDFDITTHAFISTLHQAAKARDGVKVRTKTIDDEQVAFQFYRED